MRGWKLIPAVAILALAGCSTVEMAPAAANQKAKTFVVPEGKANIYVVQNGGYMPGYNLFQAFVDGRMVGALAARTFIVSTVAPGTHSVMGSSPENQEGVNVATEAGKNYFVGVSSRIGWSNMRVTVTQLPEDVGKSAVREASQAKGFVLPE